MFTSPYSSPSIRSIVFIVGLFFSGFFFTVALNAITERKKIEEKLREVNIIINRSPVVTFTWKNEEGWPVEYVSENVGRILGYIAEDFIPGKVSYAKCIHPDDLERVRKEVGVFSKEEGRDKFVHDSYRIITKDGKEKIVTAWTFIVRDQEGEITHYKGIIEDVTERKQAEELVNDALGHDKGDE